MKHKRKNSDSTFYKVVARDIQTKLSWRPNIEISWQVLYYDLYGSHYTARENLVAAKILAYTCLVGIFVLVVFGILNIFPSLFLFCLLLIVPFPFVYLIFKYIWYKGQQEIDYQKIIDEKMEMLYNEGILDYTDVPEWEEDFENKVSGSGG